MPYIRLRPPTRTSRPSLFDVVGQIYEPLTVSHLCIVRQMNPTAIKQALELNVMRLGYGSVVSIREKWPKSRGLREEDLKCLWCGEEKRKEEKKEMKRWGKVWWWDGSSKWGSCGCEKRQVQELCGNQLRGRSREARISAMKDGHNDWMSTDS